MNYAQILNKIDSATTDEYILDLLSIYCDFSNNLNEMYHSLRLRLGTKDLESRDDGFVNGIEFGYKDWFTFWKLIFNGIPESICKLIGLKDGQHDNLTGVLLIFIKYIEREIAFDQFITELKIRTRPYYFSVLYKNIPVRILSLI